MASEESHTLSKAERLCGKTAVAALLAKGKTGAQGCLRYRFAPNDGDLTRILVSVPKRSFKRAVKRNLLKRRIREAYRLQKHLLETPVDIQFIYTSREVLPFQDIFADMTAALDAVSVQAGRFLQEIDIQ